ncbi:MAG: type I restriction enzyme HsdR N-terminal domain-containing protein [Lentimicrobiaceae bacterium]|nr:type I restriction enzyme HsdR N-terminal domain-containing protein [Lentimicrobiaceae bacterium]
MSALPSSENITTFARRLLRGEVCESRHLIKPPARCRQCGRRSKTLEHPFLKVGSNKKIPIKLVPDYIQVENNYAWVLDAKSPNQRVNDYENVEQVYSYASHPDIRSTYFAICNGLEFSLYRRDSNNTPKLQFSLDEIEHYWDILNKYLSPNSFQVGKNFTYDIPGNTSGFDYATRQLLEEIPVKKRASKIHFGVHGYFTKQSWNVVAEYIKNFSKPSDLILDPFGGSGVTAIEAIAALLARLRHY